MKIILFLCCFVLIAKQVSSAPFDGYNYEAPSIPFDYSENSQVSEDENVNQAKDNSLDYDNHANIYNQELAHNSDVYNNEANEAEQQGTAFVNPVDEVQVFPTVVENQQQTDTQFEQPSVIQTEEVDEHHLEETQNQESQAAIVAYDGNEQADVIENTNENNNGYIYEPPRNDFTLPPPLEGQLDVETSFVHQDLGSENHPRHRGSVKRIKLKDLQLGTNSISSCENARHWTTVVSERAEERPQDRRLTPYTEVITDDAYFQN